jgi:hypothetical protein
VRYAVTEYSEYWRYVGTEWVNGPGGKVEVSRARERTTTTSIEGAVGAEIGKVWGAISAQLGGGVTWSTTYREQVGYEHPIADGKFGHLQYRIGMLDTAWTQYIDYERCADEWTKQGRAQVVAKKEGYLYWPSDDGHAPPPAEERVHHQAPSGPASGPPVEA